MFQVEKRDGGVKDFDLNKITGAISKAFDAVQMEYNDDILSLLSPPCDRGFPGEDQGWKDRCGEYPG